jgi:prepilin-type N-terminal cleavage/methylation domain-containing protein
MKSRGFTLIEIAVVLAIIAILAAILTPIVTSYIDQARVTRANSDTKKIAEAVLLYKRDTSVFPGYDTFAHATANAGAGLKDCLTSDGTTPTFASGTPCGATGDLFHYLNVNTMGIFTNNASAESVGGGIKFRAPYLDGLGGQDPWGTAYLVTSKNFANAAAGTTGNWAFAVSAGPNTTIDSTFAQPKVSAGLTSSNFASGGDDITALIQ